MSSLFPSPHLTSSHTICSFSLYSFRHHENLSDLHQYIIEDTPPFPPNQQQSTRPGPRVINLDDESMYVLPHISFIPKYSSFSLMCTLLFPPHANPAPTRSSSPRPSLSTSSSQRRKFTPTKTQTQTQSQKEPRSPPQNMVIYLSTIVLPDLDPVGDHPRPRRILIRMQMRGMGMEMGMGR